MILFFYGQDTFRSKKKLIETKKRFLREVDPSGIGLVQLDGEKVDLEKINQVIGSASLLIKKRLIIIENIFANKNEKIFSDLLDYLTARKNQADNLVLFWDEVESAGKRLNRTRKKFFEFLAGQKFAQEFKPLSSSQTVNWIKKEVSSRGGKITRQAAASLAGLLGNDLWQINNEIDKLIHYQSGQKLKLEGQESFAIGEEEIKELVRGLVDENIFSLTDAISQRNKPAAVRLYQEQLAAGSSDEYLFNMIVRQFRILLMVRQALDSGFSPRKLSSALKLHPFVAQKGIGQARGFSLPALKNILNKLIRIDYEVKSGKENLKTALSSFIARL